MEKNKHVDMFDSSVVDNAYVLADKIEKLVSPLTVEGEDIGVQGITFMLGLALFVNKTLSHQRLTEPSPGVFFGMLMDRLDTLLRVYGELDLILDAGFWNDFSKDAIKAGRSHFDPIPKYGRPDDTLINQFCEEVV